VIPAGKGAIGYKSATFHKTGTGFKIHRDILKYVYHGDVAAARKRNFGSVLYNRGLVNAMFGVEAVRTAQAKFGNKPMTGEQVRWGLENLNVTRKRLAQLGMGHGFTNPVHVTCADHETNGPVIFQQWDGKRWKFVSDWIKPMRSVVRPMIVKAAMAYAKENKITPRACS